MTGPRLILSIRPLIFIILPAADARSFYLLGNVFQGGWVPEVLISFFSFFRFRLCVRGGGGVRSVFPRGGGLGSPGFRSVFLFCVVCSGGAGLAGHSLSLEPGGGVTMQTLLKHGVFDRARKQNKENKKKERKKEKPWRTTGWGCIRRLLGRRGGRPRKHC